MTLSPGSFSDIEDQLDSVPNGLTETSSLLERLQHAEHRAELAEAALARAQDDLQKMRYPFDRRVFYFRVLATTLNILD